MLFIHYREKLVLQVGPEMKARPDLLVLLDPLVPLVHLESLDQKVLLERKAPLVSLVVLETKDPLVPLALLVLLAHLASR